MLDSLLYEGFDDHDAGAERYAAELEAAADGEVPPKHLVQFARVAAHTIGEHLGDWPRAARLAGRLVSGRTPDAETATAWGHLYVARLMAGDVAGAVAAEITCCLGAGPDFRAAAMEMQFLLVAAMVGCGRASEAGPVYGAALALARQLGEAAPHRAIAVASNNLASELLEAAACTAQEAELMQAAADASHEFWLKCGDWRHDERGRYLQALVANVLGEPSTALAHVEAALDTIDANGDAPVDRTFLRLAQAHALALADDADGAAQALAISDGDAAGWDDPGLRDWYAEERARVLPNAPPWRIDAG
jgi:hypothetical protein